jgi:L-cysteate sulfo-lyase
MRDPMRYQLAHLPTPLEPMERLSAALGGPKVWIKRDDQTDLATGGNKTRKLELLVADALARRADVMLTVGAVQSNHCRQTVAAAARACLVCVLVLRGTSPPREEWTGNILLDDLLGARIWRAGVDDPLAALETAAHTERAAGRTPYVIPEGILLDPVYIGKGMAGLMGMIRKGEIGADGTVLFWHTGGVPAIFAYAADLLSA